MTSVTPRRWRRSASAASAARQLRSDTVNPSRPAVDSARRAAGRSTRRSIARLWHLPHPPACYPIHPLEASGRTPLPRARILQSRRAANGGAALQRGHDDGVRRQRTEDPGAKAPRAPHERRRGSEGAATRRLSPRRPQSARALPIRSSPVGTAPSLRATLSTLKTPAASRPRARAREVEVEATVARNPVLQELEPRLLMSADLNPLAARHRSSPPPPSPAPSSATSPTPAPRPWSPPARSPRSSGPTNSSSSTPPRPTTRS